MDKANESIRDHQLADDGTNKEASKAPQQEQQHQQLRSSNEAEVASKSKAGEDQGVASSNEKEDNNNVVEDPQKAAAMRQHLRDRRFSPDGSAPKMTVEQRERKRLINRMSAQRKRQRERYQLDSLTDQFARYTDMNTTLVADNDRLQTLLEKLQAIVRLLQQSSLASNPFNAQQQENSTVASGNTTDTTTKMQMVELLRSAITDCLSSVEPSMFVQSWQQPPPPPDNATKEKTDASTPPTSSAVQEDDERGESPLERTSRFLKHLLGLLDSATSSIMGGAGQGQAQQSQRQIPQQEQTTQPGEGTGTTGQNALSSLSSQQPHTTSSSANSSTQHQHPLGQQANPPTSLGPDPRTTLGPSPGVLLDERTRLSLEQALGATSAFGNPHQNALLQQALFQIMHPPPPSIRATSAATPVSEAIHDRMPPNWGQGGTDLSSSSQQDPNQLSSSLMGSNPGPEVLLLLYLLAAFVQTQQQQQPTTTSTATVAPGSVGVEGQQQASVSHPLYPQQPQSLPFSAATAAPAAVSSSTRPATSMDALLSQFQSTAAAVPHTASLPLSPRLVTT